MIQQNLPYNVYLGLINAASPSAVNPYITTSALSAGYVPYTGATANLDLGLFSITAATAQVGAGVNSGEALEVFQGSSNVKIGSLVGTPASAAIYLNQATPSGSNYTILDDTASLYINGRANNSVYLQIGNFNRVRYTPTYEIHTTAAGSGGAVTAYTFDIGTNTNQTADVAIPGYAFNPGTRSWITANITNQREFVISSPTYAASNPSSISNAYTLFVTAPTAGANVTINNNYAAGFEGNINFTNASPTINCASGNLLLNSVGGNIQLRSGSVTYATISSAGITIRDGSNILLDTGTGSKIATSTTQKIGFWNATPIVQPTNTTAIDTLLVNTGLQASGGTTTYFDKLIYGNSVATSGTNGYGAYFNTTTGATNNYAAGFNGSVHLTSNNTGIFGTDSTGLPRTLIYFTSGDNINIAGRPGVTDVSINPTASGIGLIVKGSGVGAFGLGVVSPSARVHLMAGSAGSAAAPLKFTSGTNQSTPEAGTVEYNGRFFMTESDAVRRNIVLAENTTKTTAGAPYTNDGYIEVQINGTNFKLMTTA